MSNKHRVSFRIILRHTTLGRHIEPIPARASIRTYIQKLIYVKQRHNIMVRHLKTNGVELVSQPLDGHVKAFVFGRHVKIFTRTYKHRYGNINEYMWNLHLPKHLPLHLQVHIQFHTQMPVQRSISESISRSMSISIPIAISISVSRSRAIYT